MLYRRIHTTLPLSFKLYVISFLGHPTCSSLSSRASPMHTHGAHQNKNKICTTINHHCIYTHSDHRSPPSPVKTCPSQDNVIIASILYVTYMLNTSSIPAYLYYFPFCKSPIILLFYRIFYYLPFCKSPLILLFC